MPNSRLVAGRRHPPLRGRAREQLLELASLAFVKAKQHNRGEIDRDDQCYGDDQIRNSLRPDPVIPRQGKQSSHPTRKKAPQDYGPEPRPELESEQAEAVFPRDKQAPDHHRDQRPEGRTDRTHCST